LNAARCRLWNREEGAARYFMSGEDLTLQAGVALQQDLALVSLLGLAHAERNGHHYVNGMAGLPLAQQAAVLEAHPDLYERSDAASTQRRPRLLKRAIAAGKHVYCEKPLATSLAGSMDLYQAAKKARVKHGVAQDKLWLPGLLKLQKLRDAGFFGRLLSVRGEF